MSIKLRNLITSFRFGSHRWASIFTLIALSVALNAGAQKEYKEAKLNIKNKRYGDAEKQINSLLGKQDESKVAKFWALMGDIQYKLYLQENEKAYLKQRYDTASFFNRLHKMYECYEHCDSLERDTTGGKKGKCSFRKDNASQLYQLRQNLCAAGQWMMQKRRYPEAYSFLATYLNLNERPMFGAENPSKISGFSPISSDKYYDKAAAAAVISAHAIPDHHKVLTFGQSALKVSNPTQRMTVMEYLTEAYAATGDTARWVEMLKQGVETYPEQEYFFVHLTDYFIETGRFNEGLRYANEMQERDMDNVLYMYAKILILTKMKRYDETIGMCREVLKRDKNHTGALYNLGLAYCCQAEVAETQQNVKLTAEGRTALRETIRGLYSQAREPLEKMRFLAPKDNKLWAPLLYRVYLTLNMGREFEEIEKLLK